MGWREELLDASIGGVPFKFADVDVGGGRLSVRHEFAGSKTRPWREDLGPSTESFTISAYVLGKDYVEQRDRVFAACLRPGQSVRLVLPTWAPRYVAVERVRIRESSEEGGFAAFSIECDVVDDQVSLSKSVKPTQETEIKAAAVETQAESSALENLELDAVPDHVREGAAESLRTVGRALLELDFTAGPLALVGEVSLEAQRLIADASALATAPADLVSSTIRAVEGVLGAVGNAAGALEAYRVLFELEIPAIGGNSLSGLQRDRNAGAVLSLVRQFAIAGFARAAIANVWDSRADAERARLLAFDAIDREAEIADDEAYSALVQLRSSLAGALPPDDEDLPDLVALRMVGDTTTLALAYRLFDDASRDDEIRSRNRLRNPARIGAGVVLEVLSK